MHPENTFYYEFAEEQAGYYAGAATYFSGEDIYGEVFDEYSKDAYEMYFDLWGGEEEYKFDEKSGTYHYIDGDEEDDDSPAEQKSPGGLEM